MIKRLLSIYSFKWSIYIALCTFFIACFLGYASRISVDTIIKKSIIGSCVLGLGFYVITKIISKSISDNIDLENAKTDNEVENGEEQAPEKDSSG